MAARVGILKMAFVLLVASLVFGFGLTTSGEMTGGEGASLLWKEWKDAYGKKYDSLAEELAKRAVWEKNMAVVREQNSKKWKTFDLAMNKFADQTHVSLNNSEE